MFIIRFHRFLLVGTLGFLVDAGAFTLLLAWLSNPYAARLGAFVVAVGVTFALNRRFTFEHDGVSRPCRYFFLQGIGASINFLVFSLLIEYPASISLREYIAFASGSLAALFFNYEMSRRYVFT